MIKSVEFMSRPMAEAMAADASTAVISISSPGQPARLADGFGGVLRLEFDELYPMTVQQAQDITMFVRRLDHARQICRVVVHCDKGRSRSVTVALFLALMTGASLQDRDRAIAYDRSLMQTLKAVAPAGTKAANSDEFEILRMLMA